MKFLQRITSGNGTGEDGFGLLFGLFAMAIIGVIGWTMVTNGLVDITISDNYRHKSTAFFAADSGLEQSVVDMKLDDDWLQQVVDPSGWTLANPLPNSITINGHTISPTSDGAGGWVPGYYPYGGPVDIGEGTYQREIYLPISIATVDCGDEAQEADEGSGGSKSKDSKSKDSKSKGSGSNGNDSCNPSWDNVDDDSGSGGSRSKDSGSKDSGSGSLADAGPVPSALLGNALQGLIGMLAPRDLLLAVSGVQAGQDQGAGKVDICHNAGPGGKVLSLAVGSPAYQAHMAHGDTTDTDGWVPGAADENEWIGGGLLTISVRATGTAGETETAIQVLRADIEMLVNPDGTVEEVRVTNWVQER